MTKEKFEDFLEKNKYGENSVRTYRLIFKKCGIMPYIKECGKEFADWDKNDISEFMKDYFGIYQDERIYKSGIHYDAAMRLISRFYLSITDNKKNAEVFKLDTFKDNYFKNKNDVVYHSFKEIEEGSSILPESKRIYFLCIARFIYLGGDVLTLLMVTPENIDIENMEISIPYEGKYIKIDQKMVDLLEEVGQMESLGKNSCLIPIVDNAIFKLSVKNTNRKKPDLDDAARRVFNIFNRLKKIADLNVDTRNLKLIGMLDRIRDLYPEDFHPIFQQYRFGKIFMNEIKEIAVDYGMTEKRSFEVTYKELKKIYDLREQFYGKHHVFTK